MSSGQVFLAQLPAPTLARYLAEPLERFTPRTLTDAPALLERLREVRREGLAWVREEYALGISSVAAPVADSRGEVVAAVHVHGPSYRFPAEGAEESIARAVRRTFCAPQVFAGSRKFAEEWAYRFLGAAVADHTESS